MGLKTFVNNVVHSLIPKRIRLKLERKQLGRIQRLECRPSNLRCRSDLLLSEIFGSREIESMWFGSEKELKQFNIPDGTDGVNPGDRRAIYYLISAFKPAKVLEIGTHIGASTIHIASALHKNQVTSGKSANLVTVDIVDVNSPIEKPWLKHGTTYSPAAMVDKLGCEPFVEFVTDASLNFLANCKSKYDFIFLDGNHSAKMVYQEIPAALELLNQNGVILLHDYFPDMKPLWSNGSVIAGPFWAAERFRNEGVNVVVVPLGELPWPTKLKSHVTSLALLVKDE